LVKATLDRPKAVDINAKSGFVVSCPIPGEKPTQSTLQLRGTSEQQQDVDLSLWLPRSDWELGETIEGKLEMQAHKDFKLSGIRVELVQFKIVLEKEGNISGTSVKANLAESTIMKAGQTLTLPFQIEVPRRGAPSIDSENIAIFWRIEGILDRPLAKDYHVVQDLRVFSQPTETMPPSPTDI
jgi:hypothetical protein